jgi:hypothetical protein
MKFTVEGKYVRGITLFGETILGDWDASEGQLRVDKAFIPELSSSWFKGVSVIRKETKSTFKMFVGQFSDAPFVVYTKKSIELEILARPHDGYAYSRPGHTIQFIVPDSSFLSKMKVHEAAAQKFIKSQSSQGGAPSSNNSGSSAGKFTSTPQQGAACDWSKHGNTLVKKGSDYFLCDGGVWTWWKSAASGGGSGSDSKPDVKPGQPCSPLGARVESKSNVTVVCNAAKVGRVTVLTWRRVN